MSKSSYPVKEIFTKLLPAFITPVPILIFHLCYKVCTCINYWYPFLIDSVCLFCYPLIIPRINKCELGSRKLYKSFHLCFVICKNIIVCTSYIYQNRWCAPNTSVAPCQRQKSIVDWLKMVFRPMVVFECVVAVKSSEYLQNGGDSYA